LEEKKTLPSVGTRTLILSKSSPQPSHCINTGITAQKTELMCQL